jgi:DNA-binding transcriptional ArsR family regulator
VDVFAALADPVRRAILRRLCGGPSRVVDLAADHDISRPAISRHLRLLGEAGVVQGQDRGRERHYFLVPDALAPVRDLLAELQPASEHRHGPERVPIPESALDALETEVRRTVRQRRTPNPDQHSSDNRQARQPQPQNHQETA